MSKSHLITCPKTPTPLPKISVNKIIKLLWAQWKTLNHFLHEFPPPTSSHHQIQDPQDLTLHNINTYWPDEADQKWWMGSVGEVDEVNQEMHVFYSSPWDSTAWIPLSSYGWYVPYDEDDVRAWNESAPFLHASFYIAETNRKKARKEHAHNKKKKKNTNNPQGHKENLIYNIW